MSRYLLDIICPACGRSNHGVYYHTCGGKRYIDEDLYLYCERCHDKTFISDSKFKCELHSDFRSFDKRIFLKQIAMISQTSKIPSQIIMKMVTALQNL